MTDYGHDLIFGSFVTPTNQTPQHAVTLAQASERAGLDLVTVQDHPYQPAFLDTWTLLSYMGGATRTISLSPNVANLPLRPPAVLARSAASLDLLTGGRVELGLGAGAFWDAIAANGGRRLAQGEAVTALREAIAVIRAIWDADAPGAVRIDGDYYRVVGAKRGPAPAHDIGIWLGAYKPKMLALTGEVANGWLPSLGYLDPADLPEANARIDEAALAAGRQPSDVRRLLNVNGELTSESTGLLRGPVAQWVEQLAELTLVHGVSAFILGSDDPAVLERFGVEIAPAVRELVATERAYPTVPPEPTGPAGPPAVSGSFGADGGPTAEDGQTAGGDRAAGPGGTGETRGSQYDRLGVTPTPDPGVRLSDERLWDESTRPTRPESPPDVTYTRRGQLTGSHLVEVHDHLRSELVQIRELVGQVEAGRIAPGAAIAAIDAMTIRQNNWTVGAYCAAYCRLVAVHHGIEDSSVFPHLRSCEAALEPVIDRLGEEHHVIHDVLELLDGALVGLVSEPGDFTALRRATDILTDTLLSHLAYEEHELIEPLARYGFYPGQMP